MNFKIAILSILITGSLNAQIEDSRGVHQQWRTDLQRASVDLSGFTAIIKRDGTPPIDNPEFWSIQEAEEIFNSLEPVIVFSNSYETRAYPLSILMYHEIVNDTVGDDYISVTFCPLCNASIVYNRQVEYDNLIHLLDFGVSGMLRGSDLVMWDRQTESWWQQLTGEALVGEMLGAELEVMESAIISYDEFKALYPDGKVLARPDDLMEYGKNPYVDYDKAENRPSLFEGEIDERLPPMERIVNVFGVGGNVVYPWSVIEEIRVLNHSRAGEDLVIFYTEGMNSVLDRESIADSRDDGMVRVFSRRIAYEVYEGEALTFYEENGVFKDVQTKSIWSFSGRCTEGALQGTMLRSYSYGNHFAFAWLHFYPETEIYER